jgi:hypothetical protein
MIDYCSSIELVIRKVDLRILFCDDATCGFLDNHNISRELATFIFGYMIVLYSEDRSS